MFRVLYVDDEPVFLLLCKTHLERSGEISVDTATSAEEALDRLGHGLYDGIISDYQMPVTDGIGLLTEVRRRYPDLPFILFTGKSREEIAIEALNKGADFYLQKGGDSATMFAELSHALKTAIDRKRIHEELKESRQRLADVINFLPDATFAIDLEGNVIVWNRAMEEMSGIPGPEIVGTGNHSYAVPFYGERRPVLIDLVLTRDHHIGKHYPEVKRKGDGFTSEGFAPTLYAGRGATIWFIASPLYDRRGKLIGAIEAVRDVTDRKSAEDNLLRTNEELRSAYEQLTATEEELRQNYDELSRSQQDLRQSEERYRHVVEDQTELICRFTPDGKLTFVNDAYCRYFGLDRNACIGNPHTVVIPPEDTRRMNEHLAALTRENPVAIVEHRILMPDGDVRWQRWSDRAIFDAEGEIVEYQSVGRDTTERNEVDRRLKQVNAELQSAYVQLAAKEQELRANYEEISRNQAALRTSEERYRHVVEDQTELICRFTPDGKLTFVNDAYCRYFGLDRNACIGNPHTVVIPPEDTRRMNEHLAALTRENPVAIVEHRILMPDGEMRWQRWSDRAIFDAGGKIVEYQSVGRDTTEPKRTERALHEANRKLNLLSSITRHDILNQITVLQGALGLIEINPSDIATIQQWLEKAILASKSIRNQISFTQQYQDIGVQEPRWQNVHNAALTAVMDGGYQNVSLDQNLEEVEVFADPLLRRVFSNLLDNAIRHGGTVTRIQIGGVPTGKGFVIWVEDNGGGIAPEDKERIFQKGFGQHTGLGLFLVSEVLAITGLSIREIGEYGRGARFEIQVPTGMFR